MIGFSSPFIEERLYLNSISGSWLYVILFSSPFIEERLYLCWRFRYDLWRYEFSSPFIEERLYLIAIQTNRETYLKSSRPLLSRSGCIYNTIANAILYVMSVLVPFYRGAVVFDAVFEMEEEFYESSRPLLSRSGCIFRIFQRKISWIRKVLVPFYRGAVVFSALRENYSLNSLFSSPFIEERLYFKFAIDIADECLVLVPFYRGAVVFERSYALRICRNSSSRPLLSRSGCI